MLNYTKTRSRRANTLPAPEFGILCMKFSTNPNVLQAKLIVASGKETTVDVVKQIETLPWRLLAEYDEQYQSYVAWSIDTGAVASAATLEEVQSLIKRVLENDIRISCEMQNIDNLCRAMAPPEVRVRWSEAAAENPNASRPIMLNLPNQTAEKRGVQTEVRIGKTKESSAA